jgi:uncharacterized protein (TIGR03086 family)
MAFAAILDRYRVAGAAFGGVLRRVRADQWSAPTPCTEWDVRHLVNHMCRGNLNYAALVAGGSGSDFLRLRDADALGENPILAYAESVEICTAAFRAEGALDRIVDYPLGRVTGRAALAIRTADTTIHTWDLARAIGADERLDAGLVAWLGRHLDEVYAGLAGADRFFGAPLPAGPGSSDQDRLLRRLGREPGRNG